MFSIGETRWRMLRRLLKFRGKAATFTELRSYCQYAKDIQNFDDLVRIGCMTCVVPHKSAKTHEQGQWIITKFGKEVADMGEVTHALWVLLRQKPEPKEVESVGI